MFRHSYYPPILVIRASVILLLVSTILTLRSTSRVERLKTEFGQQWSVGFWTSSGPNPVSDIDWGGLTHIAHIGIQPRADSALTYLCAWSFCSNSQFGGEATALIRAAHQNNVKVLLVVNNASGELYSKAISHDIDKLVKQIMTVVRTYGYDGIDVDWENSVNWSQMELLLSSLRKSMGSRVLTVDAVSNDAGQWGSLQGYVDRVSVMTYDMAGTWNPYSWFNAALYGDPGDGVWSVELAKVRMAKAGVPAAKLNIGIPFYGWMSLGGSVTGPRQTWKSTPPSLSQINYNRLASQYNLSTRIWDNAAQVPWVRIGNGWITFDDARSITAKVSYARRNKLGGWVIWALDQDYFPSQTPRHPLLAAIKHAVEMDTASVGSL